MADWELILQQKQAQINKDNIRENRNQIYHEYKVGDKFMLTKHNAYKHETPYTGPFTITQYFTNGTVRLKYGHKKLGIIYVVLSHINLIQTLEILTQKICMTNPTYDHQLYTFVIH